MGRGVGGLAQRIVLPLDEGLIAFQRSLADAAALRDPRRARDADFRVRVDQDVACGAPDLLPATQHICVAQSTADDGRAVVLVYARAPEAARTLEALEDARRLPPIVRGPHGQFVFDDGHIPRA